MKTYEQVVLEVAKAKFSSYLGGSDSFNTNCDIIGSIFEIPSAAVYADISRKYQEVSDAYYAEYNVKHD